MHEAFYLDCTRMFPYKKGVFGVFMLLFAGRIPTFRLTYLLCNNHMIREKMILMMMHVVIGK